MRTVKLYACGFQVQSEAELDDFLRNEGGVVVSQLPVGCLEDIRRASCTAVITIHGVPDGVFDRQLCLFLGNYDLPEDDVLSWDDIEAEFQSWQVQCAEDRRLLAEELFRTVNKDDNTVIH